MEMPCLQECSDIQMPQGYEKKGSRIMKICAGCKKPIGNRSSMDYSEETNVFLHSQIGCLVNYAREYLRLKIIRE
jgi:hypothetical protein